MRDQDEVYSQGLRKSKTVKLFWELKICYRINLGSFELWLWTKVFKRNAD